MDLTELPPLFCGSRRPSPKLFAGFGEYASRRPSFAPRGNSIDRTKDSQTILFEQRPSPLPTFLLEPLRRRMIQSTSMDSFPNNKHISRVSSLIKRSCRSLEVYREQFFVKYTCYYKLYLFRTQNFLVINPHKKKIARIVLQKLWLMVASNILLY